MQRYEKTLEQFREGIPVDPVLPDDFDATPNNQRPPRQRQLWNRPYIVTVHNIGCSPDRWLAAWPEGIRYDVRCLDGGCWDRSTGLGQFKTMSEALQFAENHVPSSIGMM